MLPTELYPLHSAPSREQVNTMSYTVVEITDVWGISLTVVLKSILITDL